MVTAHTRTLALVALLIMLSLCGCRAMDTRDHYGKAYSNEKSRFYMPEKNAKVGFLGHALRWKSGVLEGFCTEERLNRNHYRGDQQGGNGSITERVIIDNIVLQDYALFDSANSMLTADGQNSLKQLVKRINSYDGVRRIELEGHTDSRGGINANKELAIARAESVREFLQRQLNSAIPVKTISSGELKPIAANTSDAGRQRNRRVEVKVIATQVRKNNTDSTLCHPTPNHISSAKPLHTTLGQEISSSPRSGRLAEFTGELPISVGDQLKINVAGDESFSGIYEVSIGGGIDLPLLGNVPVQGLTATAIKKVIGDQLVEHQLIRPHALAVDTAVQQWATVNVFVKGAVFAPGRVSINHKKPEEQTFKNTTNSGDYAANRMLSAAIMRAGGVRPDADLSAIEVVRNGNLLKVDLSKIMEGELAQDLPLISGDEVVVPSSGYYQGALVRPTQLTPPGIRVFMSNPTVPILGTTSASSNKDVFSLPYGTRFLRGLVTASCVGGAQMTNASRRGVLISTNPFTGATEVIERSIQQLVSDPDRDDINPHLMPHDGIACYDSDVSNVREVARSFSDLISPFVDLTTLFNAW